MREETRTVFITDDGQEFSVIHDAVKHEKVLKLVKELQDDASLWFAASSSTPFEIATWILDRYELITRGDGK